MPDPTAPSAPVPAQPVSTPLSTAGALVLAIAALYFGREIFIPFVLAVLLAFALAPIVNWLRRRKLPKLAAIGLAVTLAFALIGGMSFMIGTQLIQLAGNLPTYQQTIKQKLHVLRAGAPGEKGMVENVTDTLEDLSNELSSPEPGGRPAATGPPEPRPIPVTVESPTMSPFEILTSVVGPLLAPLATAGIVIVLVIFMLYEREDLRDRFIRLVSRGDVQKSTQAIRDAGKRVSRYLLMQLLVNVSYGVPIGVGLYFIGVPNAVLWGLLAIVLRFIPYIGPVIAALFPLTLALAVDPGWSMLLWTVALFVVVELVNQNAIEPWLYGSSTGLSSLAIIMGAVFWTTLWGPVGLFMATPLTVCLVVIGRYVPQLEFLDVLLGAEPVLAEEERFYQRLLSGNVEEAVEIAETAVDETSAAAFYDAVAIPALRLAENDRQRSAMDVDYRRIVAETAIAVVREVAGHVQESAASEPGAAAAGAAEGRPSPVLSIAGRTELDGAAAEMAAQVLAEKGVAARILAPIAVSQDAIGQLDLNGVEIVCLSYFSPQPQVFARYISRRLRRRAARLKIVVCYWNPPAEAASAEDLAGRMGADAVFFSLAAAAEHVTTLERRLVAPAFAVPAAPDDEEDRLKTLRELGIASAKGQRFDALAKEVARAFGMPIALVSLVEEAEQHWPGAEGLPADLDAQRKAPRETSICGHVVAEDGMIVIEDAAKDPRFAENPFLLEKGIRFYAGAPLRTAEGHVLGSLCVIDTEPRAFPDADQARLQSFADALMARIEAEHQERRDGGRAPPAAQAPAVAQLSLAGK